MSRAPDGDPIDAARALTDAPDWVNDANPGDSCGEFELGQDQSVPPGATECLDAAALPGRNAELAWTTPTAEGDPIVWFAFAQPGQGVVVLSTNEFDSHGGEFMWSDFHCPDAVAATSTTSECKTVVDD